MTVFIYLFIYFEIHLNQFDSMHASSDMLIQQTYADSNVDNVY